MAFRSWAGGGEAGAGAEAAGGCGGGLVVWVGEAAGGCGGGLVVRAGEAAGSKLRKAESLGIEIVDEEAFVALMQSHNAL